ncbi:MAG TPA: BTAD domain-containing putative transcriptional regulator, partial [Longimicrobiales bacterium]|nr:BTAD domain-containing putative transcriptional regulator [Longimicrobiales bacterium]
MVSDQATAPPLSLPHPLTHFIGRAAELGAVRHLLEQTRLLTLTGMGGSGKTRLAIEAAAGLRERYADRIAWIELAALTDPATLAPYIASALGLREAPAGATVEGLLDLFGSAPNLLILDNCEHIVEACARLVDTLLRGCARLTVLATSREPLGIEGERAWLVPPLSLPKAVRTPGDAEQSEAVALFIDRARAVAPSFTLTNDNVESVARICRRLDGIPLAIELAAARVKVLAPHEIAARLEDSFRLLTSGQRTAVSRHRTLREAIDWSYALLTADEQRLLQRLAVFAGGFRLDSAEEVCSDPLLPQDDVLNALSGLVDKSLVTTRTTPTATRYGLLDTVRQYADEKLRDSGDRDEVRARHAEHFLMLTETAAPHLIGGAGHPYWVDRLIEEADNLRALAQWSEEQPERVSFTLRLGAAVQWLLFARGWFQEGRDTLTRALARADGVDPQVRAVGATALAAIHLWQGDTAPVRGLLEPWIPVLRAGSDRTTHAYALSILGTALSQEGDPVAAQPVLGEAVAIARMQESEVLLAICLYWQALAARARGELDLARASLEEAVGIGRALNNPPSVGHPLTALARLLIERAELGDTALALTMLVESLEVHRMTGDRWGMAWALEGLATVSALYGDFARAVRLSAGAESVRASMGAPAPPRERAEVQRLVERARVALGGSRLEALWQEARAWPQSAVLDYALAPEETEAAGSRAPALTSPPPHADLQANALGPLQLFCAGQEIDLDEWPSVKARELLLFLLCHPDGVTREQVGLALWPEASATQLRNSFHVTMHRLRKGLGNADWVQAAGERYRFQPTLRVSLDAAEFERIVVPALRELRAGRPAANQLRAALRLYRGDFLAGEKFGDWTLEWSDRLQRLQRDALRAL